MTWLPDGRFIFAQGVLMVMRQRSSQTDTHSRSHRQRPAAKPSALLMTLLARAATGWWAWWQERVQAVRLWRERRRAASHARAAARRSAQGEFTAVETLEPRMLLSADLNVLQALPVVQSGSN